MAKDYVISSKDLWRAIARNGKREILNQAHRLVDGKAKHRAVASYLRNAILALPMPWIARIILGFIVDLIVKILYESVRDELAAADS